MKARSTTHRVLFAFFSIILVVSLGYLLISRRQINLENSGSPTEVVDQAYVETTIGENKLLTITGTIDAINLVEKDYPIAPQQQVLTISRKENPNETYFVALGGPERGLIFSDKKLLALRQADKVVEETVTVAELMPKIAVGDTVSVELDITPFGPANQTYIRQQITDQYQKAKKASAKIEPVEIWYLAVGKIILEN